MTVRGFVDRRCPACKRRQGGAIVDGEMRWNECQCEREAQKKKPRKLERRRPGGQK